MSQRSAHRGHHLLWPLLPQNPGSASPELRLPEFDFCTHPAATHTPHCMYRHVLQPSGALPHPINPPEGGEPPGLHWPPTQQLSLSQVWGIGCEDRAVYFRQGVTPSELSGKTWKAIVASRECDRSHSGSSSSLLR